jgi:hypothetical protein
LALALALALGFGSLRENSEPRAAIIASAKRRKKHSPGRKPWVKVGNDSAPKWRKKCFQATL